MQSEQTRLSIDSETIKEIVDMFMTVRQFIPLIEPVAASVLTTYRDIKGGAVSYTHLTLPTICSV